MSPSVYLILVVVIAAAGLGGLFWFVPRKSQKNSPKSQILQWKEVFQQQPISCLLVVSGLNSLDLNLACQDLLNISGEEIQGKSILGLLATAFGIEVLPDRFSEAIVNNNYFSEELIIQANKRTITLEVKVIPLADDSIKGDITLISLLDLTEKNTLESRISELESRLTNNKKVQDRFIRSINFALRNPLNSLLGFGSLLMENDLTQDERANYQHQMHQSGNRLIKNINILYDVCKIDSDELVLEPEIVNLNHLMASMKEVMERKKKKYNKGHLMLFAECEFQDANAEIMIDPFRLEGVLGALLDNAIQYTAKGFIQFGYRTLDPGQIMFYVRDSGIGMPELRQRALAAFFEQKDPHPSEMGTDSGLGLAMALRLVRLLGGKIWFESVQGKGSTFHFTIPIKSF